MENIIHEFKIIETENGFRIEITGDKDAIRQMLRDFSPHSFFGNTGPFPERLRERMKQRLGFDCFDFCDVTQKAQHQKKDEEENP